MPEYLAPGVYVEELPSGLLPIPPLHTSIALFAGRGASEAAARHSQDGGTEARVVPIDPAATAVALGVQTAEGSRDAVARVEASGNELRIELADARATPILYGCRGPDVVGASDWTYVPVRRLFRFLEKSLHDGTQWAVFEPDDRRGWANVRREIVAFLGRLFPGSRPPSPGDRVVPCATTRDDTDCGRPVRLVGMAPLKPAEFVVIRISRAD